MTQKLFMIPNRHAGEFQYREQGRGNGDQSVVWNQTNPCPPLPQVSEGGQQGVQPACVQSHLSREW